MHTDLVKQLQATRAKRCFDVASWVEKKAEMLNAYMRSSGLKACVVSVSGGVDSAVTMALLAYAKKQQGSPIEKILGVAQPIHSTESIWKRALLLDIFAPIIVVNQTEIHDKIVAAVDTAAEITGNKFSTGQLKSYQRTPVGYYTAQLLTQQGFPCIVLGTGNYDEDGYLCYFCKAGDGIADVQLIADLHKSEVFTVGHHLKVPGEILNAAPSADLWDGQTDEDELGISYDFVELFTEYLRLSAEEQEKIKSECSEEAWKEFEDSAKKAKDVHRRNSHKLDYPKNLNILPVLDASKL